MLKNQKETKDKIKQEKIIDKKEILRARLYFKDRFEISGDAIFAMIQERDSERYQRYYQEITSLKIDSPIELAIKYEYINLVELFKKISQSI